MWASRHQYLSLRHTLAVPPALRDALQGGPDPPCPVARYALYEVAQGTTAVLSNRDSGLAAELYATATRGRDGLLRGVVADLIDGLYAAHGPLAGDLPADGALAVQVYCEEDGAHLVTAVRGVVDWVVDATVVLAVTRGGAGGQRRYGHVRTGRRRKRIIPCCEKKGV